MTKLGTRSLAALVHVAWETRMLAEQLAARPRDPALLGGEPRLEPHEF